jgi:hypothetical protein
MRYIWALIIQLHTLILVPTLWQSHSRQCSCRVQISLWSLGVEGQMRLAFWVYNLKHNSTDMVVVDIIFALPSLTVMLCSTCLDLFCFHSVAQDIMELTPTSASWVLWSQGCATTSSLNPFRAVHVQRGKSRWQWVSFCSLNLLYLTSFHVSRNDKLRTTNTFIVLNFS